jgi:hypothetical protein
MKRTYSLIALALSVCLFIYLFYRSKKTVINELISLILSPDRYAQYRSSVAAAIPLNDPILFSLPGGLWVFCMTILSKDLYIKIAKHKIRMVFVPVLFAVGLEFFQLLHLTNGTFDFWDVGFYVTFWLPAYFGFQSRHSQDLLSPFTLKGFICLACFFSVYLAHVSQ